MKNLLFAVLVFDRSLGASDLSGSGIGLLPGQTWTDSGIGAESPVQFKVEPDVTDLDGLKHIEITPKLEAKQISFIKDSVVDLLSQFKGQQAVAKVMRQRCDQSHQTQLPCRICVIRKDEREVYTFQRPVEKPPTWNEEQKSHEGRFAVFFIPRD